MCKALGLIPGTTKYILHFLLHKDSCTTYKKYFTKLANLESENPLWKPISSQYVLSSGCRSGVWYSLACVRPQGWSSIPHKPFFPTNSSGCIPTSFLYAYVIKCMWQVTCAAYSDTVPRLLYFFKPPPLVTPPCLTVLVFWASCWSICLLSLPP